MADFPRIFRVRQKFSGPELEDPARAVAEQIETLKLDQKLKPGARVAITAGSRGIANIDVILRVAVEQLKQRSAEPFIIPTMGSHGGGTAEGQRQVLVKLGITEDSIGCPILATMDTVELGHAPQSFSIHFDRHAYEADHVLVVGRVKPHTGFAGRYQSGLVKMLLLGLGKHHGALAYHNAFVDYSFDTIAETICPQIIERGKVIGGLAVLENGYCRTAQIFAIRPEEIMSRDAELLELATQWMAKLPFDAAHLLVIDEIGKHISGTGMDTNIVGRKKSDHKLAAEETPKILRIAIRNVVGGNATGIGIAEFCTDRAIKQTDLESTRINALTSNHVAAGMLPISFPTDRSMIDAALQTIGMTKPRDAHVLWIKNTAKIEIVACAEAFLDAAKEREDLEILDEPREMLFDDSGNLVERW